jgi:NitT/TauT family transport system ATP-binding protein
MLPTQDPAKPTATLPTTPPGPGAIQVTGLHVSYGAREVLHGIDLSVARGEFVSIVGASGCGKSTLLQALAGFIPYQGAVVMPGRLSMVFQNYAVFPWLTVRGNIEFGLPKDVSASARKSTVDDLLSLLGLTAEAASYPFQLSGGQTQRVAIGRAFASNHDIVFMDEPFGALDIFTREKMQTWLLNLREQRPNTILFVTHSVDEAVFLSDRVVLLGPGAITGQFQVPFGRPRSPDCKFDPAFLSVKQQIVACMEA